jgi:hypothetical protein
LVPPTEPAAEVGDLKSLAETLVVAESVLDEVQAGNESGKRSRRAKKVSR